MTFTARLSTRPTAVPSSTQPATDPATEPGDAARAVAQEHPQPLLSVRDLHIGYRVPGEGLREVVSGLDIDVAPGEFVTVVGESGSGKSTLVQGALGLLPANAVVSGGSILFSGVDVTRWSDKRLSRVRGNYVGFIPQDPATSLNPVKRIGVQVVEAVRLNESSKTPQTKDQRINRAVESLRQAGLGNPERVYQQFPHELSGGMKQRALIAIALAGGPKLIVADEPTSALDVTVQRVILDHLETLRRELGIGVLLITHDLGIALDRSDRIIVMKSGRVVEHGDVAQIRGHATADYTRQLLAAAPTRHSERLRPTITDRPAAILAAASAHPAAPALEAIGVGRHYSVGHGRARTSFAALDGVDLAVARGHTHAVVGESGAGKSTLARLLTGLDTPDAGEIRVGGIPLASLDREGRRQLRRNLQFVYQNPFTSLDPLFTVSRIIAEPLKAFQVGSSRQIAERVAEVLDHVSLDERFAQRRPTELSGGQRQRVAIARAIALQPDTIVLDEAVSALDVSVQAQILQLLAELQQRLGLSYLFITHDLGVVRLIGDDVTVMQNGRVVESGTVDSVFDSPREDYTRRLIDAIPSAGARR